MTGPRPRVDRIDHDATALAPDTPIRAEPRALPYTSMAWLLLAGVAAFQVGYIATGAADLAPDEAQYWDWSRRLEWAYFSKGPTVAYLVAASTALGAATPFWVRLPAVLLGTGTAILLMHLARTLFGTARVALLTLLVCVACPMFAIGATLMTTDAPWVFCWVLLVVTLWHAAHGGAWRHWLLAGGALGLGLLTKYTMLLALPCAGLYLAATAAGRPWLRRAHPYAAVVLAAVLCTPLLVWNAAHDWAGIRHVVWQAGLADTVRPAATFFNFLGAQLGVVSPPLFVGAVAATGRATALAIARRDDAHALLAAFALPPLLFFFGWSLFEKVQANWAAVAYPTALVAGAGWVEARLATAAPGTPARRHLLALLVIVALPAVTTTALAYFPGTLHAIGIHLPPRLDPTTRLQGWRELGEGVGAVRASQQDGASLFVLSDRYQITSELAFYVPGQPIVYNFAVGRRTTQYEVWGGLDGLRGRSGLFVTYGPWDAPEHIRQACPALRRLALVPVSAHGRPLETFSVFRCDDFQPPTTVPLLRGQT